ncbi:hypothetical protein AAG612_03520 [Citromicrobium bathyomarinum]|uniref:hypothetical protein n=1 Tax=Citromicrobium bathyomarinum TaxID=72174 RepID=UPI003159FA20
MVQHDVEIAVLAALVGEGVFDLRFRAVGAGEVVVAHGDRHRAVFADDGPIVLPSYSGVGRDGEAAILGTFGADEVAQRFLVGFAELVFGCQRRLEEDRLVVAIGIVRVDMFLRAGAEIAVLGEGLADRDDAFAPCLLGRCDFGSGDGFARTFGGGDIATFARRGFVACGQCKRTGGDKSSCGKFFIMNSTPCALMEVREFISVERASSSRGHVSALRLRCGPTSRVMKRARGARSRVAKNT